MAKIPQSVLDMQPVLQNSYLKILGRGKVRDSYLLGSGMMDNMLIVATGRCSIFDFVLNVLVKCKGEVLNALNVFWTTQLLEPIFETDLVAFGSAIDDYLPESLKGNIDLQKRATIVRRLPPPKVEDVVRIILTGSGWESYQETGVICGHKLPSGLKDGSLLPFPIYTPTTKAEVGHDVHITADTVVERYGFGRERLALQATMMIAKYAAERGIILADTKFEISKLDNGKLIIVDEKGTPDSSRFLDKNAWLKALAKGKFPPSLDKQYVREWGRNIGINKMNPERPEDVDYVHSWVVPEAVASMTTRIYRYIFWRLVGSKIETFQREKMGIAVEDPRPKIHILIGSASDEPQIERGLQALKGRVSEGSVSIISCDRNPSELRNLIRKDLVKVDIVIAGAGMAARLPGFVKSELCVLRHPEIPVIGVAFKGATSADDEAAVGCIERIPGQPVEVDVNGHAYFGADGFSDACFAALDNEFLPKDIEHKPSQIDFIKL